MRQFQQQSQCVFLAFHCNTLQPALRHILLQTIFLLFILVQGDFDNKILTSLSAFVISRRGKNNRLNNNLFCKHFWFIVYGASFILLIFFQKADHQNQRESIGFIFFKWFIFVAWRTNLTFLHCRHRKQY